MLILELHRANIVNICGLQQLKLCYFCSFCMATEVPRYRTFVRFFTCDKTESELWWKCILMVLTCDMIRYDICMILLKYSELCLLLSRIKESMWQKPWKSLWGRSAPAALGKGWLASLNASHCPNLILFLVRFLMFFKALTLEVMHG